MQGILAKRLAKRLSPLNKMSFSSLRHNVTPINAPSLTPSIKANTTLAQLMTAMHTIAPLSLADSSWDNVGLLLESPSPRKTPGVHLCIDLTTSVTEEALSNPQISTILCYHPIIFRGLKSLTLANSQQASLLRLVTAGVSVYSPHTSLDATMGGINDWLALSCAGDTNAFEQVPRPCSVSKNIPVGYEDAGMGRVFALRETISASTLVGRLKSALKVDHVQIALPPGRDINATSIKSIAVCAGSGGSVLAKDTSDAWVTGEMSHHEVLAATASGRTVILTNHTNTERGYLADVLKPWLEDISAGALSVSVSASDRDPLVVV